MTITVKKDKNKEICSLNQYDAGQTLQIEGLDLTGCAMYWGGAYLADEDPPVESEKREFTGIEVDGVEDLTAGGICDIPDKALSQTNLVKGAIYQNIDGVSETIATVEFTPIPQYMPTDYVSADNTVTLTVLIEGIVSDAIDEADLVPYTGATKTVDLNYQDLTGLKNIKSANGRINEEESGQFAFGGQVNTSAAHAFAMGDELSNSQIASAIFGFGGIMPINGRFAVATGTQKPTYVEQKIGFWVDKNGNTYVGDMNHLGAGGFNLSLFTMVDGQLLYDGEPITGESFDNAEVLEKFTEENDQLYFDGLPISGVNVEKFSDLPENGTIALVQNDEVITQPQSDFDAETEYSLFVNPQIPLDVDFDVAFVQSESEFDNGAITLTLNTTELSLPVFVIEARITGSKNLTIKQWYYAENEIISETLTILKGWSAVEVVDDVVIKNESISYTDLPNLDGAFVEANSLGGTYFLETPYNLNKAGLYAFSDSWKRVDNDNSLWCESTGYLSTANGYGTTASGNGATANGYETTASGDVATANGYGTTASGKAATANGISTTASGEAATANGISTTASGKAATANGISTTASGDAATANGISTTASANASASFGLYTFSKHHSATIVGKFGETGENTLFAVANGMSTENESLALNIKPDEAIFTIPVLGVTADAFDSSTKFATTAFVQGEISTKELKSNKVTTIDANSTDEEYPSAKAVFDFVPEIDVDELVPTMTEYDANDGLTLNNSNYWTTTASIEFALPTPVAGKVNTFDLFVKVANSAHIVTFSAVVEWAGSVAYVFGEGTHKVCGEYDPINSKWLLTATASGVPA